MCGVNNSTRTNVAWAPRISRLKGCWSSALGLGSGQLERMAEGGSIARANEAWMGDSGEG
jgi:hypothetical protein